ncbi:MAG TPA: hypothetical protein VH088_10270 [Terriglobales bacterium]|nr:hypothetical protein [Terriglobales bacterium]
MRKVLTAFGALVAACIGLSSCGNNYNPYTTGGQKLAPSTGLTFRVFVSNPLFSNGASNAPVLNIIDATTDLLSPATVSLAGTVSNPGLMAQTPDKNRILVFSDAENRVAVVDKASQSATGAIGLPGATTSLIALLDNATAYAAVQTAAVAGQTPGAVEVLDIVNGKIKATIPVPNAKTVVLSQKGGTVLAFGDSTTATVITVANVGTNATAVVPVAGFDHPVSAVFSADDTKAYVLECGAECGGTTSAVTVLDLTTDTIGARVPVSAATIGFLDGTTLFVAGTPAGQMCESGTAATSCGVLTAINTQTLTASGTTATITDGYHDRMVLTGDGQIYIGANHCTEINTSGGGTEVRGCLSIFNTADGSVTIPPDSGDVTGIQSIVSRKRVYLVQGNQVRIYSTTDNKLQAQQPDIVGPAVDVKLVD